eukprot:CAMPEP_0181329450 /NCGR_PEP_ID=MMETSP1101-20121128/23312_1 /TAXON_ID=46948 /ORGANISM="Rhodomonas abbreviata, Strain Caron Lab Isolate" /LENGTH=487 /DNA_ID=CAMNT_0023438519 /DNA_START=112 /DNA_END=1571 /DNA_ORIENTATION=+
MFERTGLPGVGLSIQVPFPNDFSATSNPTKPFAVEQSPLALRPMVDEIESSSRAVEVDLPADSSAHTLEQDMNDFGSYGAKTDLELLSSAAGERPEDIEAMYAYKLQVCPNKLPHDWTQCHYAHDGEVARRRNPAVHSANPCAEYEKSAHCGRGDRCPFAHGVWERGLHPQRYKTSLCSKGELCNRKICFFAHQPSQVRKSVSGFQHAGLAGFHGFAGFGSSGGSDSCRNAPWVGKVSRRKQKQDKQQDKQQDKHRPDKQGPLRGVCASAGLDPSCASFIPGGMGKDRNLSDTKACSAHDAACGSDVATTKAEPEAASSNNKQSEHCDEVVAANTAAAPAAAPAAEEQVAKFERQKSLEHNMLWAKWVKKLDAGNPGGKYRVLRRDGSWEERETKALQNFNTAWVDGLLREDSGKVMVVGGDGDGEAPREAASDGWGSGGELALNVSSNNREWTRWIMTVGSAGDGSTGCGSLSRSGSGSMLAELKG